MDAMGESVMYEWKNGKNLSPCMRSNAIYTYDSADYIVRVEVLAQMILLIKINEEVQW